MTPQERKQSPQSQEATVWRTHPVCEIFGYFERLYGRIFVGLVEGFCLVDFVCEGADVALACMAKNWRTRGRSV